MNRAEKEVAVKELNEELAATPHVLLTSFRGLTVNQSTELRSKIRNSGGRYRVIKNRLVKLAVEGTPAAMMSGVLSGPCALVTHGSDPIALAKSIADFSKANPQVEVLAGVIESKDLLDPAGVKALAALPGLPELQAQLLCLIQTPATMLVRLIATPATQVSRAVDARREQLEKGS